MSFAPLVLDSTSTTRHLSFIALIDALKAAFAEGCHSPTRQQHPIEVQGAPDGALLLMPAWTKAGAARPYAGVKLVTVFPGNTSHGLPSVNSSYVLYDGSTGAQLALLDGDAITSRRTAAVAALAADYLARPDARRLLVIGAGRVGRLLPFAYRSVRDIQEVQIWDINESYAAELASRLAQEGLRAKVMANLKQAVGEADIIGAATLSTTPLIKGEWLRPGTHVDLIGGFTPSMREADDAAIMRSAVFIDTVDALNEAGDLVQPREAGVFSEEALKGTLQSLCAGVTPGRGSSQDITLFKTVGTALADLAAAKLVYEAAGACSKA